MKPSPPQSADTRSAWWLLRRWRRWAWCVAASAWFVSTSAAAQDVAADAVPLRQQGGVAYVSAGPGAAARAQALRVGADMNLLLTFARAPSGKPLADVALAIRDSHGQVVLDLASAEPLLLARLVPGAYTVTATVHGQTLRRNVVVPRQGRHSEGFNWPDSARMRLLERVALPGGGAALAAARVACSKNSQPPSGDEARVCARLRGHFDTIDLDRDRRLSKPVE